MTRCRWPRLAIALALAAMVMALSPGGGRHRLVSAQAVEPWPTGAAFVPGELIVTFRPGVAGAERDAFYRDHAGVGATEVENLAPSPAYSGPAVRLVGVAPGELAAARTAFAGDPRVMLAELNYIVRIDATPNDPSFSQLWGMHNTGQTGGTADADTDAPEAWDVTTGSTSVLGFVVDTGVDYTHPDLVANLWTNPGETPGDAVDNDGNGYVDDVHGIDAITDTGDPADDHGHGTHCTGTIGGVGNNGAGVAGVNWRIRVGACRFMMRLPGGGGGGTTADAIQCINYVNDLKANRSQNIRFASHSWGGDGFDQALMDAMAGTYYPGMGQIAHMAAAGNSANNNDANPFYPASYTLANLTAVAATDHNDAIASFSSYGATSVDLAAPGVSILSTLPGGTYAAWSGTSMATPHVAGCAGLVAAVFPSVTAAQIKSFILDNGDSILAIGGNSNRPTLTNDRLNCSRAVRAALAAAGADLAVSKTDAPDPVIAGTSLTYSVTVLNNGPADAQNVQVADSLPGVSTFLSASPSSGGACSTPAIGSTGTVTCTWSGTTAVGATRSVTIVVRVMPSVPNGTVLTNTVTTSSATTDPSSANNSAMSTTTVGTSSDLFLAKTDSPIR